MTPERYKQIGDLFHAALELEPAERAVFLDKQCAGDVQLRREVESLIASHSEAPDFIGSPAMTVAAELFGNDETDEFIGKTIGRYLVHSLIGIGGMGRVYLAEDVELGRRVALKLLLKHFTHDEKQLLRFRQEARAASALNHPNILTVHEIGQVDGTYFIATEYVDGETLRERLHHSSIALPEAIDIATQIADALATAHAAGIIHRDIKPENVMLRRDGYVKVLDFGLAKLTEKVTEVAPPDPQRTATTLIRTDSGVIMGTVYYMSPEQIRGVRVDGRTDIWSLGVVLYELVADRRPFEEETQGDTIVSILQGDTASVVNHISDTPAQLRDILSKALTKNIDERYQTAKDMATDLRHLRRNVEGDSLIVEKDSLSAASSKADRTHATTDLAQSGKSTSSLEFAITEIKRHKTSVALVSVLFIAVLTAAGFSIYKFFARAQPARRAELLKVVPLTTLPGMESSPAFSPDGKQVAFVWARELPNFDLYIKLIGAGEPLRLTSTPAKEMSPAWSPDGRYIAFLRATGDGKGYYLIPALGGAERKLTNAYGWALRGVMSQAISWSPDGRTLAIVDKPAENEPWSIYLVSVETGERRKFITPPLPTDGDSTVAFSPDGRTLAFVRSHNLVGDSFNYIPPSDIYLAPVAGGDPVRLTFVEKTIDGLAWTPSGDELVFSAERGETGRPILWRIPAAGGTPTSIVDVSGDSVFEPSIAAQGNRLAFAQLSFDFNIYRIELTGQSTGRRKAGPPTKLIASTRTESDPRVSPDGRRIVFISNRSGNSNMWVCDADGNNAAQLTDGLYVDTPSWSPDGRLIAFNSVVEGNSDISTIGADGGVINRLTSDPYVETTPSWSPDGNWLYFSSNRTGRAEVWKMPATGGPAVQLTHGGGFNPVAAPNGRTVYYLRDEKEPWLWAVTTEGGEETRVIETNPVQGEWIDPTNWAVSGAGIYFLEGKLGNPYTLKFFDFETRRTTLLMTFGGPGGPFAMIGLSLAPDERSIVYAQRDTLDRDLMLVENFH